MGQMEVTGDEARLLAVRRAITDLGDQFEGVIGASDASEAEAALSGILDVTKLEAEYSAKELKAFLRGYVAGLAIAEITNQPAYPQDVFYDAEPEADEGQFVGEGPSGGVALQQGHDPNFVTQSGVH